MTGRRDGSAAPPTEPEDARTTLEDLPHDIFNDSGHESVHHDTGDEVDASDDAIAMVQTLFPGHVVALETESGPASEPPPSDVAAPDRADDGEDGTSG